MTILYFTCICLYLPFSRQPDYFDGEFTRGVIHYTRDSASRKITPKAFYTLLHDSFAVPAAYIFRNLKEGEDVRMIYDSSNPKNAAVYRVWGYWFRWGECLGSIILLLVLYYVAEALTSNPSPEGLMSEMEQMPAKRKYSD